MRVRSFPSLRAAIRGTVAIVLAGGVTAPAARAQAANMRMRDSSALKWGPAPAVFRKGARMAVVSGDPMAAGPYVVRLAMPARYRVAPHFHPTDEHLRIISGTFLVGMGDTMRMRDMKSLTAGDTITAPATMHHYAATRRRTVVEVSGTGPFKLTYVNPADMPKP